MEKLTVLLFAIQSLEEMDEATMGNNGDGGDGESGGSGLGATAGTSAAGLERLSSAAQAAAVTAAVGEETATGLELFEDALAMNFERTLGHTKPDGGSRVTVDDDDEDGNGLMSS